jgi:RIO-like serine/threonine protein kinase
MKIKVHINPKYEEALSDYVRSIPTLNEQLGEVIYKARNTVFRNTVNGYDLVIKSFKVPMMFNRIAYTFFRHSKARRSYDNALRLCDMCILTPTPIACVEEYEYGLLKHSYYVCLYVEGEEMRFWETKPNSDKLLLEFADFMLLLRAEGVWHKDFSPGNILYDKDYNFYLVDINRMQFNVHSKRKFLMNFRSLHTDREQIARLARIYSTEHMDENPQKWVDAATRVCDSFWKHHNRKHNIEKTLHLRK